MKWSRLFIGVLALVAFVAGQVDPRALVRRAVELEKASAERELAYGYRENVISKTLDSAGNATKTKQKVHDVLMIDGTPQRVLLEEDGRALTAAEISGQQDFVRRVVEVRTAESEAERRERIAAFEKKRARFRDAIAEVPEAFEFRLTGEEVRDGRACWLIEASPRPGYQPKGRYGKIFSEMHGKIWIDKASGQWKRAEGTLRETVNLGWIFVQMQKNTSAVVEQKPFGNGGWLMSYLWYRTSLRVGLFMHYRAEELARYWGYQKMSDGFLEQVLAAGYPATRTAGGTVSLSRRAQ